MERSSLHGQRPPAAPTVAMLPEIVPMTRREWLGFCLFALAGAGTLPGSARADRALPAVVEFNRDVRPILSENCFACHGPDAKQRKAKLRLDTQKDAFADRGGYHVLLPGKPAASELLTRLTETDARRRMPPAKFGKQLTP